MRSLSRIARQEAKTVHDTESHASDSLINSLDGGKAAIKRKPEKLGNGSSHFITYDSEETDNK